MTKHSCQGYQLPTCVSLLHHSRYGCGNGSLAPASVTFQPSTSALVCFVWSPHLHQSAFTGVTSLSVPQSQTPKPAPPGKLKRPSLCCCHCLLRILSAPVICLKYFSLYQLGWKAKLLYPFPQRAHWCPGLSGGSADLTDLWGIQGRRHSAEHSILPLPFLLSLLPSGDHG